MKLLTIKTSIIAVWCFPIHAFAEALPPATSAGEQFEITTSYETTQISSHGGSSGSSNGQDTLLERVVGVSQGGLELEYDLTRDASKAERARSWQFPARVFKPTVGPMQLLNAGDLELRLEKWLGLGKMTREACGRWIFTWNAFRIECDPQSVLKTIEAFDLRSFNPREGIPYRSNDARGPGILKREATETTDQAYRVDLDIEPDIVRRAHAESDVVVGEITEKPVTLEGALIERAKEEISGTISVIFETNADGGVWRRTKVTKININKPGESAETKTAVETVSSRRVF